MEYPRSDGTPIIQPSNSVESNSPQRSLGTQNRVELPIAANRNTYAKRQREQDKKQLAEIKRVKRAQKKLEPPKPPAPPEERPVEID